MSHTSSPIILAALASILIVAKCNYAPSVIIVGAGSAGIAAATKLLENNISNITILEAEGRIGGRVNSVKFGDAIIDLGAQWCHGVTNNLVYELVKDYDLLIDEQFIKVFYDSTRKSINQTAANKLLADLFEIYDEEKEDGISLGEYMVERFNKSIAVLYENDVEQLELASQVLEHFMHLGLGMEGAFSLFDVAANCDYEESEGSQVLGWKGRGYKTILDVLMKKYPDPAKQLPIDDKIVLNKEVVKIVWDNGGVTVECLDGSVYGADHIIFTPSLGVLKERYEDLFHPSLPKEKVNAIQQLGIAAVSKIFLHFPNSWWANKNFTHFNFLWSNKELENLLQEFPYGPNENGKSWLTNFFSLMTVDNVPNVLVAWIGGEFVPQIEACAEDTVIDGILFVLNKFLGHEFDISKPDAVLRHNWYSNPHFRGTYSFQTIESRESGASAELVLSQPLSASNGKPILMFAGEATNPIHYATVHGAIESGHREANRIINFYK